MNNEIDDTFRSLVAKAFATKRDRGTNNNLSLSEALSLQEKGMLDFPPHQREPSWPPSKYREYVLTILTDTQPPGSFEMYLIIGDDGRESIWYLNDGSQRLRAAKWFKDNCEEMGISDVDAIKVLASTSYNYTLKTYKNHKEGLARFQFVNNNIKLTLYQITIGDLIYCQGAEKQEEWSRLITDIQNYMELSTAKMGIKELPEEYASSFLPKRHLLYRHNLSLFLRFIVKEKRLKNFRPTNPVKIRTALTREKDQYFELELAQIFSKRGLLQVRKEFDGFKRAVNATIKVIDHEWGKIEKSRNISIQSTAFRWLLDIDIWRKNNQIKPQRIWIEFVYDFLKFTRGSSKINYEDNEGRVRTTNVRLSDVGSLDSVCRYIGSDFATVVSSKLQKKS